MKAYEGVDVQKHIFLTAALVEDKWPASCHGRFTPRGNNHTNLTGGWVGPRAGLDDREK
jgi:hypothetical protein